MEVIGGGGELEGGGVVAVDRDHWCGSAPLSSSCVFVLWEKPEKETILGKTSDLIQQRVQHIGLQHDSMFANITTELKKRQGKCFILPTIDFIPKTF